MPLRCLIIDDNREFLDAAGDVLGRDGIDVVGVASDAAEALQLAADLRPDVTLVDVYLGGDSGFDLARRLVEECDGEPPAVLLISTYSEKDLVDLIAASPAVGFVSKSELSGNAIRTALGVSGDPGT